MLCDSGGNFQNELRMPFRIDNHGQGCGAAPTAPEVFAPLLAISEIAVTTSAKRSDAQEIYPPVAKILERRAAGWICALRDHNWSYMTDL